jgi:uncharacterized protein (TIGR02452 family)
LFVEFRLRFRTWWRIFKRSLAQEEDLCRHTALYTVIKDHKSYFNSLKQEWNFFTDALLYSPDVPFVFSQNLEPLPYYFKCSVITSAAVKASALRGQYNLRQQVNFVMLNRIRKIIQCAIQNQTNVLILGAFGCGAYGNESSDVVSYFNQILNVEGYRYFFDEIVFPMSSTNHSSLNQWAFGLQGTRI